ncbi:oligosaccharide flippase family protein [Vibrio splendidus]|uniref:oligosaccharide flippase family protein n=1 Tax=Vibrio splendidus TaxID=29497 RepID=UPI0022356B5F|nr:oligosaccharide flippase family protein [Vibrio splendidus]MCW4442354.1 oligosaccharide flippase family protein [Vibrio splendidus]
MSEYQLMDNSSLIKKFFGTAGIKLFASGLSMLLGIILARLLEPENYGVYGYIVSLITLLCLPAIAGLPNFLVREVAKYEQSGDYPHLRGILNWSTSYIVFVTVCTSLLAIILIRLDVIDGKVSGHMVAALVAIPFKGLVTQLSSVLNGFGKAVWAQVPLGLISPLVMICVVLIFMAVGENVTVDIVIISLSSSYILSFLISFCMLIYFKPKGLALTKSKYKTKEWHKSLLPFSFIAIISTMNNELATVFLGIFGEIESVAYFRVSMQAISLVSISLLSVNAVTMPLMAKLNITSDLSSLQSIATKSVRLSCLISYPILITLAFFGDSIIEILFGSSYSVAYGSLIILVVGQLVNVTCGSVGSILSMINKEGVVLKSMFITLIITISLLVMLVPIFQDVGAAIAVSMGLIIWNVMMSYELYRLTKIKSWLK